MIESINDTKANETTLISGIPNIINAENAIIPTEQVKNQFQF